MEENTKGSSVLGSSNKGEVPESGGAVAGENESCEATSLGPSPPRQGTLVPTTDPSPSVPDAEGADQSGFQKSSGGGATEEKEGGAVRQKESPQVTIPDMETRVKQVELLLESISGTSQTTRENSEGAQIKKDMEDMKNTMIHIQRDLVTLKKNSSQECSKNMDEVKEGIDEKLLQVNNNLLLLNTAVWGTTHDSPQLLERFESKDQVLLKFENHDNDLTLRFTGVDNAKKELDGRVERLEGRVVQLEGKCGQMESDLQLQTQSVFEEKLGKVVSRFENRLPTLLGFLTVIFTMTVICQVKSILLNVLVASVVTILFQAILTCCEFWKQGKAYGKWRDSKTNKEEYDSVITLLWPFIVDFVLLLSFAFVCAICIGIYINKESCVPDSPTPPSPPPSASPCPPSAPPCPPSVPPCPPSAPPCPPTTPPWPNAHKDDDDWTDEIYQAYAT